MLVQIHVLEKVMLPFPEETQLRTIPRRVGNILARFLCTSQNELISIAGNTEG